MDTRIEVWSKDSFDNLYCAIVLEWHKPTESWINAGIVVRKLTPEEAFRAAKEQAIKYNLWE